MAELAKKKITELDVVALEDIEDTAAAWLAVHEEGHGSANRVALGEVLDAGGGGGTGPAGPPGDTGPPGADGENGDPGLDAPGFAYRYSESGVSSDQVFGNASFLEIGDVDSDGNDIAAFLASLPSGSVVIIRKDGVSPAELVYLLGTFSHSGVTSVWSGCTILATTGALAGNDPLSLWLIPKGDPGATGADGTDGVPGAPGADGDDGAPGAPGADGDDGAPGAPGADGADGAPGGDGAPGPEGPPGTDGTSGTNGADGAPGADGADGVAVVALGFDDGTYSLADVATFRVEAGYVVEFTHV